MNIELKDITFCNTVVNNICSDSYKKFILEKINTIDSNILKIPTTTQIDPESIESITKKEHILSVHSNGNTYYLYLFKDRHNVSTMIDHKKMNGYDYPRIIIAPFRMNESLYEGTLLKGELIKNNKNKWIYLVNDLLIHKNKSLVDLPFIERISHAYELLNKYYQSDPWIEPCTIKIKCYYTYNEINRFISHHVKNVDFATNGILFTPIGKYQYSRYVLFESKTVKSIENNFIQEEPVFGVKKTKQSGIYQLYCKKDNSIIKHSIARIPNLKVNMFLQELCKNYDDYYNVLCKYDTSFNKWIPLKKTDATIIQFHNIIKS